MGGKSGGENEAMGGLLRFIAAFVGKKPMPILMPRGFLGFGLTDPDKNLTIKTVLADSPAAQAGLQAGDEITKVNGKDVKTLADLRKRFAELKCNENLKVTVRRDQDLKEITVKSGEGL